MWRKRIIAAIVILSLLCASFTLPLVINYYNDKKTINRVQYVEDNEIDIYNANSKESMASKIYILDKKYNDELYTKVVELSFNPGKKRKKEIYSKINDELELWFNEDRLELEKAGVSLSWIDNFNIEDIRLYSFENISYFEIKLSLENDPSTSIDVVMDSELYKIYSMDVYTENQKQLLYTQYYTAYDKEMKKILQVIADNLSEYYEVDAIEINNDSVDKYDLISFGILSNLEWNIVYWENDESNGIHIGMVF